jgi:hypothetical protein
MDFKKTHFGRKYRRKTKPRHLSVVNGERQKYPSSIGAVAGLNQKAICYILFFLALFLLSQILLGWVWGAFRSSAAQIFRAGQGSLEVSFSTAGTISFEEEIIFAPRSGYLYHEVKEGERVPVGKKLAVITEGPLEEAESTVMEEQEEGSSDYLQQTLNWFLYGSRESDIAEARATNNFVLLDERTTIFSTLPGLLLSGIDGLEKFGPHSSFPYFTEEDLKDLQNGGYCLEKTSSGAMVSRFKPLFRIINNYCWYYSTILPPDIGDTIAKKSSVRLYFSFDPEQSEQPEEYVVGEKVEAKKNYEHGGLEITWRIDQAVGGCYNHRFSTAEVVCRELEGILVPAGALVEHDGRKGVYLLEKGIVNFREVVVLGEKNGFYLVKNLEVDEQVIENPSSVKVGQRYCR